MTERDDLAAVVDKTALLENLLSQIIEQYCQPRADRGAFFWAVLLDSSVIALGAKVKVVLAVAAELGVKLDASPLHSAVALRNAFAHQPTDSHPTVVVSRTPGRDRAESHLQILSASGKLTRKSRDTALAEFDRAYSKAKASLIALLKAVETKSGPDAA